MRPGYPTPVPPMFRLEQLAIRYGVPPWVLDTDDPDISRWVARGLVFMDLESQGRPRHE